MEIVNGLVDPIHARVVIDRERLVVRQTSEDWLRVVRPRLEGIAQIEDVLVEERHLISRMCVVEIYGALERSPSDRHSGSRDEVGLHVVAEIKTQHEELAVGRW